MKPNRNNKVIYSSEFTKGKTIKYNHNTTDIVVRYLKYYIAEKTSEGSWWFPPKGVKGGRSRRQIEQSARDISDEEIICLNLMTIANELQKFIERTQNERFKDMLDSIGTNNPTYLEFSMLADELFSEGISWFKIVTLFVFCGELVWRAICVDDGYARRAAKDQNDNTANDGQLDEDSNINDHMVVQLINCVSKYIEENLLQWIEEQDGDWLSVREGLGPNIEESNDNTKGRKNYFRMATFAAIVGGLYFCSKFILQK